MPLRRLKTWQFPDIIKYPVSMHWCLLRIYFYLFIFLKQNWSLLKINNSNSNKGFTWAWRLMTIQYSGDWSRRIATSSKTSLGCRAWPYLKYSEIFFNNEILNVDWVQVLEGKHLKGQQCIYHKVGRLLQSHLCEWLFPVLVQI